MVHVLFVAAAVLAHHLIFCHSFSSSFALSSFFSLLSIPSFLPIRYAHQSLASLESSPPSPPPSPSVCCAASWAHTEVEERRLREAFFFSQLSSSLGGALHVPRFNIKVSAQQLTTSLVQTASSLYNFFPNLLLVAQYRRRCVTQRGLEIFRAGELERALIVEIPADSSLSSETTNVEKKNCMKYSFSVFYFVSP